MSGPGRWPLVDENGQLEEMRVFDRAGPPGCLRRVTQEELWKLQGRTMVELREAMKKFQRTEAEMVREGTRATGVHTAANLLSVQATLWCACRLRRERPAWDVILKARRPWLRFYCGFANGREPTQVVRPYKPSYKTLSV